MKALVITSLIMPMFPQRILSNWEPTSKVNQNTFLVNQYSGNFETQHPAEYKPPHHPGGRCLVKASKRSIKPNGTPDINTQHSSSHSAVMALHMKDQGKWCPRACRKWLVDNGENTVPHGSHTKITLDSGKTLALMPKSIVRLRRCMCVHVKVNVSCHPQSVSTLLFETRPLTELGVYPCQ